MNKRLEPLMPLHTPLKRCAIKIVQRMKKFANHGKKINVI